jgi:hypothetical protein
MIIIITCWIIGALIGFLPLFGWHNRPENDSKCLFIPIMKYNFLVFLYFVTIVLPALIMAFFYARIYLVVMKQLSLKKVSHYFMNQALNDICFDNIDEFYNISSTLV